MLPGKFKMRGTDVAIHIDAAMLKSDIELSVSATGVVLVPQAIGPGYIERIVMLHEPRYTLYTRPTAKALVGVAQKDCRSNYVASATATERSGA